MDNIYQNLVTRDALAETLGCDYKTVAALEDKGFLQRITLPFSPRVYYRKSACDRLIGMTTDNKCDTATMCEVLKFAVIVEAFNALFGNAPDVNALRGALASELATNKSFTADSVAEFVYRTRAEFDKSKPQPSPTPVASPTTLPVAEDVEDDDDDDDDEPCAEVVALAAGMNRELVKVEPFEELYFGNKPKSKK